MAFGSRGGPVFWLVVAITAMVVGALPSSHRDHQEYPTHDTIVTDLIHTTEGLSSSGHLQHRTLAGTNNNNNNYVPMNIVINGPQNNNGGSTVAAGDGDGSSGGSNSALRGSGGAASTGESAAPKDAPRIKGYLVDMCAKYDRSATPPYQACGQDAATEYCLSVGSTHSTGFTKGIGAEEPTYMILSHMVNPGRTGQNDYFTSISCA